MKQEKVSVIIPIYNTGLDFFEPCLDSVVNQTYRNIEVILVDDGSNTRCAQMIDELSETDDRIRVFHRKNQGVSAARNFGMDVATGGYLTFVDADDIVCPIMIEHGVKIAQKTGADLVIGRTKECYDRDIRFENREQYPPRVLNSEEIMALRRYYLTEDKSEQLFCSKDARVICGPWGRLISSRLTRYKFEPGMKFCEDLLWNLSLLEHEGVTVAVTNEFWYCYMIHTPSVCRSYCDDRPLQYAKRERIIFEKCVVKYPSIAMDAAYDKYLIRTVCSLAYEHLVRPECPLSWHEKKKFLHDFIRDNEPFPLLLTCPFPNGKAGMKLLLLRANLILETYWLKTHLMKEK